MTDQDQSEIQRPERAYRPDVNQAQDEDAIERDPDLEATELEEYRQYESTSDSQDQHATAESSGAATKADNSGMVLRRVITNRTPPKDNSLKRFWRHHIRIAVHHEDCRDHFALERTFLGYLRTSTALGMIGITVAQLFRLQNNPDAVDDFGFYEAGRPLAALLITSAILVMMLGAVRFWRLQNALVRGKVRAAGWELHALTALIVGLFLTAFIIIIRVNFDDPEVPNHGQD